MLDPRQIVVVQKFHKGSQALADSVGVLTRNKLNPTVFYPLLNERSRA